MEPTPRRYHVASSQQLAPTARDASRTTEGPKQAEWEAVKDDIRYLYEQFPLKEVKRILETRGFYATERMFKSRLSQWGFIKNSSDREYQVAALQLHSRRAQGKHATSFIINQHPRAVKDLRKYIKGRRMSDDQFLSLARDNESAGHLKDVEDHVRCETPDPESIDAEAKQSPASVKTPSSLSSSPPPKQARPSLTTSSPTLALPQLKHESVDDCTTIPSRTNSNSDHRNRARRRSIRKQRLSDSSDEYSGPSRVGVRIPNLELSPMEGVSSSPFGMPPSRHALAAFDMPSDKPTVAAFDIPSERSHMPRHSFDSPRMKVETSQYFYTPGHSPTCDHVSDTDLDMLAHSTIYSTSLASTYGTKNLDALRLLNPASSDPALNEFEVVCGKCHQLTTTHFSSLQHVNDSPRSAAQLEQASARQSPRAILNPSSDVSSDAFQVAPSAKDHDHCFRWVSLCFLACIYSTKHQAAPQDTRAAELAQRALSDADGEFEAMLRSDDPKLTLTLNHTLTILHMHDQTTTSEKIMKSAAAVAERVVGLYHPAGVITRFLGYAGVPSKLREQTEITSKTLRYVWDCYVQTYEAREKDMRSIGAMYCLGYMLNVEANRDKDASKFIESESIMRQCYQLSCEKLGKHDLQSIMAMTNLRLNMERQGRIDEAIACAERAIRDSLDTLGEQHPKRLELMRNLALSYLKQGRDKEAERLYWKVLEGRISMLGRKHDFTRAMKYDLIDFLKERGRWRNANGEASEEHLKIDDLFSWDIVEADSADDDVQDLTTTAMKQLKAF